MRRSLFDMGVLFFFLSLSLFRCQSETSPPPPIGWEGLAPTPPRGWNSYDSFSWTINETEFLQNAEVVSKRLHSFGYEYVVVDYLWYRRFIPGVTPDSSGYDLIDSWGRLIPDPDRWPSSRSGFGFRDVAQKVHDMGLKFGIHVMRGLSLVAFNANTPILDIKKVGAFEEAGRIWHARDIGLSERTCGWMQHGFMSVNTDLEAGRAFLRSLYTQYAEWGVDFVKLDCVFGEDLDAKEILTVSELLQQTEPPILFSLSPGKFVNPAMAKDISSYVNMYRITADDWDTWSDVSSHFGVASDFAASQLIGAPGLSGKSWPDLDMLPLGWLTDPSASVGPHRKCSLTLDEQRTQISLWSMARSPLMYGGDLRNIDQITFDLITNPTVLEINAFSTNNKEFSYVSARKMSRSRIRMLSSARSLENLNIPSNQLWGLTSCNDPKARGWALRSNVQEPDQICWKDDMGSNETPFCVTKRKPLLRSNEEAVYLEKYLGKSQLLVSGSTNSCLDLLGKRKLTSSELKTSSSPCKWHANQMWELNDNGTIVSSYSNLCLTVESRKDAATGVRSWVATGRNGEIYLSFFNLNSYTTVMSARLEDLAKVLPGNYLGNGSCQGTDVWGGKKLGLVAWPLSTAVNSHGVVLFVLKCS